MKFPRNTLHPILQKYHREIPQLCSDHHRSNTQIHSLLVKFLEDALQDKNTQEDEEDEEEEEEGEDGEDEEELTILERRGLGTWR